MRGEIVEVELNCVGMATLTIEVDLTDHDYEREFQMMDKRERIEKAASEEHKAYLKGLKRGISQIHVGAVVMKFGE